MLIFLPVIKISRFKKIYVKEISFVTQWKIIKFLVNAILEFFCWFFEDLIN